MRGIKLAAVAAIPLALGACSQAAALTPVSGGPVTSVRMAVYDVLVAQDVPILVAPQCAPATSGFTCTGKTTDGQEIVATGGPAAPYPITITVGGTTIFEGNAKDVLAKAAQEAS